MALEPLPFSLQREETPQGRYYRDSDGNRYASVTTILSKTKSVGDGLKRWQRRAAHVDMRFLEENLQKWTSEGRMSQETAAKAREQRWSVQRAAQELATAGAARGTALHKMVEDYFDQGIEGSGPYWKSIRPFLERTQGRPIAKEYFVIHPILGYAGQLDMAISVDFSEALVDWKTGDKEKREEWMEDYYLQVAAYSAALRLRGVEIENGYVVRGLADLTTGEPRPAQIIHLGPLQLREYFSKFQARLRQFRDMENHR